MTLQRVWLEFLEAHPDTYRYSQFCLHYHRWARTLAPTMRQVHRAGEKVFVDFSGQRPVVWNPTTGAAEPVELFVGVLGASNFGPAPSRIWRRGSPPTSACWRPSRAVRPSWSPTICAVA